MGGDRDRDGDAVVDEEVVGTLSLAAATNGVLTTDRRVPTRPWTGLGDPLAGGPTGTV